jgi:hypothetical protein
MLGEPPELMSENPSYIKRKYREYGRVDNNLCLASSVYTLLILSWIACRLLTRGVVVSSTETGCARHIVNVLFSSIIHYIGAGVAQSL